MGFTPPSGLGPLLSLSMNRHVTLGFMVVNLHRVDPAPPGRVVIPKSHIPNTRLYPYSSGQTPIRTVESPTSGTVYDINSKFEPLHLCMCLTISLV